MAPAPTDEHPNLRRARFDALAREELVEPLRRDLAGRTDPATADDVLRATLLVCWRRFDEVPDPALPWARDIALRELDERGAPARPRGAASAPEPADPDGVTRLLADVVGEHTDTESRSSGTRGRSGLTWLVATAAVALIALAATYVLMGRGETPRAPSGAQSPEVLELSLPGQEAAGRCMVPTPELLGRAEVAFDGEAVSVSEGRVVLRPSRFYAGGPADRVEVAQASESMQGLVLGVRFEEGERYLVAANGSTVMVCGFSGVHDAQRERLYERAFPE